MLALDEAVRPTPLELLGSLPDYHEVKTYYENIEAKPNRVFHSTKPGQGIDPKDSKRVMLGSMLWAATYQKRVQYDEDVPEPESALQSRHASRHTSVHDGISRITGETILERNFHQFLHGQKNELKPSQMEIIRRPIREVHEKKHDWFQKIEGNYVYKDYLPPVYSVNRIIAGKQHVDQVVVDDGLNLPSNMPESEKNRFRQQALSDILKNFNQTDIKKDMNDRLETYIMAGKDDSDMSFTRAQAVWNQGDDNHGFDKPSSKYVQDYFNYNQPNKPKFRQVQPVPGDRSKQTRIDPRMVARLDNQSELTGIYNIGAGEDSIDLADLHSQIR